MVVPGFAICCYLPDNYVMCASVHFCKLDVRCSNVGVISGKAAVQV